MPCFASYPIVRAAASIAVLLALFAPPVFATDDSGAVVGFQDAAGKTLFLHDFKGRPVLINLWATWCGPCIAELPSLIKLQQDYASRGLVVIALSEDDTIGYPIHFYEEHHITDLTTYFDKEHAVAIALETRGVPTSILVTRDGNMVQRIEGPVDWESPEVKSLMNEIVK